MEEKNEPMDLETVRVLKDTLVKIDEKKVEFIPMFTNVLLKMLNAYETEITRLEEEMESLDGQIQAAQHDAIHGNEGN